MVLENDTIYFTTMGPDIPTSKGYLEKILAMSILGIGSFIFGVLPAFISERNRQRFPFAISLLLCFGSGILLATALVHILPEVREKINGNFAEVALCGGFFIIYFIDELVHYICGEAIQHSHSAPETDNRNGSYGSTYSEREPLLQENFINSNNDELRNRHNINNLQGHMHSNTHSHYVDESAIATRNARLCHTNHDEPCAQTNITGTLGLFVALSLHSAIEGLAIGVQNSATKVLVLLGAVSCHKFVMGFCLGLQFRSNPQTTLRSHFIGILVFALGAVAGIGIGMIVVDIPSKWVESVLPIVQALAGGTLLYVTVCEVMPREKASWHQNAQRKLAGLTQFLAVGCGFTIMTIINFYLHDDDS